MSKRITIETDENTITSLKRLVTARTLGSGADPLVITLDKILSALSKGEEFLELKLKKRID